MQYLGSVELQGGRGSRTGLLTTDEDTGTQLLAFVWVDRDRRYFISTASSLENGTAVQRMRWTQANRTLNAEPERQQRTIAQPKAAETFYKGAAKIDQHNRHRQDTLRLERKLETNEWHKRVATTIFGMIVIDSYLLCKGCTKIGDLHEPSFFIEKLGEQLIDNDYDRTNLRTRSSNKRRSREVTMAALPLEIDTSQYLTNTTPTKQRKKNPKTGALTMCKQGRCIVCKKTWVTTVCRECQKDQPDVSKKQFWCCRSGTSCFDSHIKAMHPDKLMPRSPSVRAPLLYCNC